MAPRWRRVAIGPYARRTSSEGDGHGRAFYAGACLLNWSLNVENALTRAPTLDEVHGYPNPRLGTNDYLGSIQGPTDEIHMPIETTLGGSIDPI